MDLVAADPSGTPMWQTDDFTLDLAYGDDQNDFELSDLRGRMAMGWRWWVDGTPYGGIVDTVRVNATGDGTSALSYKGRSVQGILASRIVRPPSGQSHLVVGGEANAVIAAIVGDVPWLSVSSEDSGIAVPSHNVRRYADAYTAVRMALERAHARLSVRFVDGAPVLSAVSATEYGDVPSERVSFAAERTYRPCNHMVGLGSGEGAARLVVDWYADEDGNISQAQSLFGLDEVAQTYDASNEDEELSDKTRDALAELQGQGEADIDLPEDSGLDVGDMVTASDAITGIDMRAYVTKVVVSASKGKTTVSYETGTPQWPEEED